MTAVSVIATVFNEGPTIAATVASVLGQTRPPDEFVVADAGSTDGTRQTLDQIAAGEPKLRVIHASGNRSTGRNSAIAAARHDWIATIDGGCVAAPGWLEGLLAKRSESPWVAGFYRPAGRTTLQTCIGLAMVPVLAEVDAAEVFLPSARSMAFARRVWAEVGGFPEEVDFAEDSLFDERALAAGFRPAFAADAIVWWQPPPDLAELARTMYKWGDGDGRAGLRRYYLKRRLLLWWGSAAAALAALLAGRPGLLPLALAPVAAHSARATRRKYGATAGASRFGWLPLAYAVANYAALAGYAAGSLRRGRR